MHISFFFFRGKESGGLEMLERLLSSFVGFCVGLEGLFRGPEWFLKCFLDSMLLKRFQRGTRFQWLCRVS